VIEDLPGFRQTIPNIDGVFGPGPARGAKLVRHDRIVIPVASVEEVAVLGIVDQGLFGDTEGGEGIPLLFVQPRQACGRFSSPAFFSDCA